MEILIEDIKEDIKNKITFRSKEFDIIFKRKYAYIKFHLDQNTLPEFKKVLIIDLQEVVKYKEGSALSILKSDELRFMFLP